MTQPNLPRELIAEGLSNGGKLTFTSNVVAIERPVTVVVMEAFGAGGEVEMVAQVFTKDGEILCEVEDPEAVASLLGDGSV